MAQERIVVCDTNIIIEALKQNEAVVGEIKKIGINNIAISVLTIAELLFGARDKKEYNKIKKYIDYIRIIPLNQEICEIFIEHIDKYALSHRIGIPDTFIASTVLFYETELYTLNKKDFNFIPNIKLYKS